MGWETDRYVIEGRDQEWYAVDANDTLAFFTPNSSGPTPRTVTALSDDERRLLSKFFETLSPSTDPIVNPAAAAMNNPDPRDSSDPLYHLEAGGWLDMSRRGLFAFDGLNPNQYPESYILVSRPTHPIYLTDLPLPIKSLVERTRIPSLLFASVQKIAPNEL